MKKIKIGEKKISTEDNVFVIAEISGNHGGDRKKAVELIEAACDSGADAVKLQIYRPDTITLNIQGGDFAIQKDNAWAKYKCLYRLYEYAHTPWEWLPELFKIAHARNVEIFGSVFDESSVDELQKYNVNAYKIAAPEIVDTALLIKVARTSKPVFISTGLAGYSDIAEAVSTLRNNGCDEIILMKCTTAYPAPPEESNLLTMKDMAETFDCHVGFSDHSIGIGVPVAAVALGALVIEKHIKLDKSDETVDSFFSLSTKEFRTMIEEIRRAEKALGRVQYNLTPEASRNKNGQRSLYVCSTIRKGAFFTEKNIRSVRPGYGLKPKHMRGVLGRRARVDLFAGDRLSWDVID